MITWHTHIVIPGRPETAVIAIRPIKDHVDDVDAILLSEIYRYDMRYACWFSEGSGLKLKHDQFWLASEDDILRTLPE